MRTLTKIETAQELAKLLNKPILYLSGLCWSGDNKDEFIVPGSMECTKDKRLLAAPFLQIDDDDKWQFASENEGFVVCDNEDELYELYDLVYGDNGCNVAARAKSCYPYYFGDHRIYALTIHADGSLGTENT